MHNKTGFIAEFGDIERMASYAVSLFTNEKKYNIFSANARARAVENFEKSLVIPQYEEFYEKILSE